MPVVRPSLLAQPFATSTRTSSFLRCYRRSQSAAYRDFSSSVRCEIQNASNIGLGFASEDLWRNIFEERLVLYLIRIMRSPIRLSTIFAFHGAPPTWADERAQVSGRLEEVNVPPGDASQNPGLGVVNFAHNIQGIVHWIENPDTAPVVLITSNRFGPDFMMRCTLSPSVSVLIMTKVKYYTTDTKASITKTATNALTSLHEDHWFKNQPLKERRKLVDAIGRYPVLRVVSGYPSPPDLKSTAKPVTKALEALGSNAALATVTLDTFRACFVSEEEVKNLLGPLRHALERRK